MVQYTFTPQSNSVFNELDQLGLLLGLPRLEDEKNHSYKARLMDVFVNRASSTYRGLINGITRELGYSIFDAISIVTNRDSADRAIGTYSAVVFSDIYCTIYSNYLDGDKGIYRQIDRMDPYGEGYSLRELVAAINEGPYFTATVIEGVDASRRSMNIFNQSTVQLVTNEDINKAGSVVKLANEDLLPDSVAVRSDTLTSRVSNQVDLRNSGQYYLDYDKGIIYSYSSPSPGSVIRYKYRDENYTTLASPVILHSLQSEEFQKKMFEQVFTEDEYVHGLPTELGADLINELMSIFASSFGS